MISIFKLPTALKGFLLVALIWSTFTLILLPFNQVKKSSVLLSAITEKLTPDLQISVTIDDKPKPIDRSYESNKKQTLSNELEPSGQIKAMPNPTNPIDERKYLLSNDGGKENDGQRKSGSNEYDLKEKREAIKEMMRHAWSNYVKYAWGANELRPITKSGYLSSYMGLSSMGTTIVDALDTLYIMDLKDEFHSGREWVAKNMDWDQIHDSVPLFELNIRFVGGLLSCYALTKDVMFMEKAEQLANNLLPAFRTKTGIPNSLVFLNDANSRDRFLQPSQTTNLAEIGSFHLEFVYLADATRNPIFKEKVYKIRNLIHKATPEDGLYPSFIDITTGKWTVKHVSFGAYGDSFYEYLLKAWIQSNGKDKEAKDMFFDAMKAAKSKLLQRSKSGLHYLAEMRNGKLIHEMSHLTCFAGGLFALGAQETSGEEKKEFLRIGEELAKTCHESYIQTETKLGSERFTFNDYHESTSIYPLKVNYILRPEVVETYFYLWRITKDVKYREWAWDVVTALQKHCRVENGFSGITNVYSIDSDKDDIQQSFFLAETLKYLYLIFADELLPLDQWVFNTEGHPLPIRDRNDAYKIKTSGQELNPDVHYF